MTDERAGGRPCEPTCEDPILTRCHLSRDHRRRRPLRRLLVSCHYANERRHDERRRSGDRSAATPATGGREWTDAASPVMPDARAGLVLGDTGRLGIRRPPEDSCEVWTSPSPGSPARPVRRARADLRRGIAAKSAAAAMALLPPHPRSTSAPSPFLLAPLMDSHYRYLVSPADRSCGF